MSSEAAVRLVVPLPATIEEWRERRKPALKPTLYDRVFKAMDEHHFGDPEFLRLIEATEDAEAVEGSRRHDDTIAAKRIKDKATKDSDEVISRATVKAIEIAMRRVLKDHNASRKQRRAAGKAAEAALTE